MDYSCYHKVIQISEVWWDVQATIHQGRMKPIHIFPSQNPDHSWIHLYSTDITNLSPIEKKKVENTAVSIMHLSQSHNSTHCTEIYKKLKACGKLWIYHSGFMINTSHIDPWTKSNTWGFIWVVFIAKQLQLINSSIMYSLTEKIDRT